MTKEDEIKIYYLLMLSRGNFALETVISKMLPHLSEDEIAEIGSKVYKIVDKISPENITLKDKTFRFIEVE